MLAYYISYHHVIGMSPFKVVYRKDPTILSSILKKIDLLGPGSAKAGVVTVFWLTVYDHEIKDSLREL